MRILFVVILSFFISTVAFSQNDVTTFLGIPVDGTKSAMIQKLKAKGFTYDATYDILKGEFNGRNSELYIVTNNNNVYRIVVTDIVGVDETDIKIRFNNLCKQFEKNGKYIPQNFFGNYEIGAQEDISYEMTVHNKRYESSYYQVTGSDTVSMKKWSEEVQNRYTDKELERLNEKESEQLIMQLFDILKNISHKSVWFMISERYGKYYINIYYDNELNMSNGEDL